MSLMAPTIFKIEVDDCAIPAFKTARVTSHKTLCVLPLWSQPVPYLGTIHAVLQQDSSLLK